jgi:hypothetical protein
MQRRTESRNVDTIWLRWMALFILFPGSGLMAQTATSGIDSGLEGVFAGFIVGAVLGSGQWLVLRHRLNLTGAWVLASAIGLALGMGASVTLVGTAVDLAPLLLRSLGAGVGLAIGQALVLAWLRLNWRTWLLTTAVGWTAGWFVTRTIGVDLSPNYAVFGASGALFFQGLTAFAVRSWLIARRCGVGMVVST